MNVVGFGMFGSSSGMSSLRVRRGCRFVYVILFVRPGMFVLIPRVEVVSQPILREGIC